MSKRSRHDKKIKKLSRALRKAGAPQAHVDLIEWLKLYGHAQTTGEAVRMLIAGKVTVESHVVGRQRMPDSPGGEEVWGIAPLIPAHHRDKIAVYE